MQRTFHLYEIKEDGFNDAILKLRELGQNAVITPWESYHIVTSEEESAKEKFLIDLRGMSVGMGAGEVVGRAAIEIEYRDASKTEVASSKVVIMEDTPQNGRTD